MLEQGFWMIVLETTDSNEALARFVEEKDNGQARLTTPNQ